MKRTRCLRASVPLLVAVVGGLVWAGCPADGRPVFAADIRPDQSAYAAPCPMDDDFSDPHEDAAASSDQTGDSPYYQHSGYQYTYPEEQYGYDDSADNENKEAAETPPQGTTDQETEGTDDQAKEGANDQAKEGANDQAKEKEGATDQYEYRYEDGYSSDDSEEVDEPSPPSQTDQDESDWLDQWWYEYYRYWYTEDDWQEALSDDGQKDGDQEESSGEDEYPFDRPNVKESPSDPGQDGSAKSNPIEYWEEYGYKHLTPESRYGDADEAGESYGGQDDDEEGAEIDAPAGSAAGDETLEEPAGEEGWSDVVQRDGAAIAEASAGGPKMLGAAISVAAQSLDRLGNALCALARQLEGLR